MCANVDQRCLRWLDEPTQLQCAEFEPPKCSGRRRPIAVCMDRYEYPNTAGVQPVVSVSWYAARAYCTFQGERLPTEAEWEYVARANTTTAYWWGDAIGQNNAVCDGCGSQWDSQQTAPVGSFKPNPFGVFDTAGNVWEWTQDCWHSNYDGAPTDGSAWLEKNGGNCTGRVVRGGSWGIFPQYLRSAIRGRDGTVVSNINIGFRVARDF